jgi:hypothetical protein
LAYNFLTSWGIFLSLKIYVRIKTIFQMDWTSKIRISVIWTGSLWEHKTQPELFMFGICISSIGRASDAGSIDPFCYNLKMGWDSLTRLEIGVRIKMIYKLGFSLDFGTFDLKLSFELFP